MAFFKGLLGVDSRCGLHARQVASAPRFTGSSDSLVASTAIPIYYRLERQAPGGGRIH